MSGSTAPAPAAVDWQDCYALAQSLRAHSDCLMSAHRSRL